MEIFRLDERVNGIFSLLKDYRFDYRLCQLNCNECVVVVECEETERMSLVFVENKNGIYNTGNVFYCVENYIKANIQEFI